MTAALLAAARTRKRGLMQILLTRKCRFDPLQQLDPRSVALQQVADVQVRLMEQVFHRCINVL
ncbi:MAG: hypothetical protein TQ37_03590 [Candidatus Synechococcus spongiarum 15L]|uniref:Uncharacterized protein n=1 Tax=Candidatus Synechococcus spongiarum 15L TaxID=1608419 RepID=A0A0G8AWU3_9SYNE|nr:MAG: hypothetical protein TQ37_03590 [Candidatus Synechococcus spongiarum 15L]